MSAACLWGNAQSAEPFDARPSKDCVRKVAVEKLQRKERNQHCNVKTFNVALQRSKFTPPQWTSGLFKPL
ncbi:hypothetical protein KUCAC02_003534 [Chaenocephalus aceratus]|uniref:Uncharacterized protein n=1 Tax=Chaenocephalus aceratus TaxID=36190 RepID=A0ACB9WLJ8_CHAAC|nr:hypothetical protein KUCAC02_003534 [Chaenocephalus aceratus]